MTIVELRVHMDCVGCETKIRKALGKLDGVDSIEVDMAMQKVTVMGWADQKKVLKTVRKTGRRAELWPFPYNPEYYSFTQHYYNSYQEEQSHLPVTIATYASNYYCKPQPSSSYNYREHGYDNSDEFGYYQQPLYATIIDEQASAVFSDENPHACSIM